MASSTSFYDEALQTMTREDRRALQDERLAEASERIYGLPIPFFRRRLEEAGIGPGELSLANLSSVRPFVKADLRRSEAEHPPFGDYRGAAVMDCVRVAQTTGTTGKPTVLFWTPRDLEVEYNAYARNQWRQGYKPGETIMVTAHPGYLNNGEPMNRAAAERYGFLCVSIGPPTDDASIEPALRLLSLLKPNRYVVLEPALQRLNEAAVKFGYDPAEDLKLPPPDDSIAFQWRQISAGADAFSYLGTECSEQAGAHLNEDLAVVEVLDPVTYEPVPPGERGNLVITTLGRDSLVVRYDIGDVIRVDEAQCPCGETTRRGFYDGRRSDVVNVGGTQVMPIDVAIELAKDDDLGRPGPVYQLVRRGETQKRLEIRAEGDGGGHNAELLLEEKLGVDVEITVLPRGTMARASYKPSLVADEQ